MRSGSEPRYQAQNPAGKETGFNRGETGLGLNRQFKFKHRGIGEQAGHGHGTGRHRSQESSPWGGLRGREGPEKGNRAEKAAGTGPRNRWVRNRTRTQETQERDGEHR